MQPPPLKNDCFALPRGVEWVPVDTALSHLKQSLTPVTASETIETSQAVGRFLAADAIAVRSNPPAPNSAVDGYGFAGGATDGPMKLPLVPGRAAAGLAIDGSVPKAHAIRILTGAILPDGVDTVVLEEDVNSDDHQIAFNGPLKQGANTRKAGEDVKTGEVIARQGSKLRPQELAILSACGVEHVAVHRRLRVGVLSTGDEVRALGEDVSDDKIYDANRPMLLSLVEGWGYDAVDLGKSPDDRAVLRSILDDAVSKVDVILTSGGASAGDEDHVSALLNEAGRMEKWRIALKPGRPLALGLWQGVPVFGLPGNPVAAFVCTLIFAEPSFRLLAGGDWRSPKGFLVPARFEKNKKPGRREYLRARLSEDGQAEVFKSEGSGRISGLAWADGLVELPDQAVKVTHGTLVRYLPFTAFGQ